MDFLWLIKIMEQVKNINLKIRKSFYNNIVQATLISLVTMIIFSGVVFFFIWTNRADILNFLIEEYKANQRDFSSLSIPLIEENNLIEDESSAPDDVILKETEKEKEYIPTVVDAVKKARPAVVSIIITKTEGGRQTGSGSGFLVSPDGLIVTNRHVVYQDDVIFNVLLNDGRQYKARVLDRDPVLDIALIKIEGNNLPYLTFADSDLLEVGETVIAIGNALGEFKNTVSTGVVSGLSRSVVAGDSFGQKEYLDKVIQTDAAINKGNSGGPLLNIYGEVVGINVAIAENSSSIGFSLPINSVKDIIDSVKKTGRIIRPYIGIRYLFINQIVKDRYNLTYDYGVLIQKGQNDDDLAVLSGSPAEKAGLQEGDIILEVDGQKIDSDRVLSYVIRNKKIGDFLSLRVYSNGSIKMMVLILEQAPLGL